jgi:molybdate transport system ATP-binding protein
MIDGLIASFTRRFFNGPEIRVEQLLVTAGVTVLFGASGSGKTTILRCLAGLEALDEGTIRFNEETWFDASSHLALAPQHRRVGFVPQDFALFPHLTVERNIAYGLNPLPADARRERVGEMIQRLDLQNLEQRLPHELSGGQQQRVALARAVARKPQLLLLDEPFSALDTPTRQKLRGELRRWLTQLEVPTLLVTHDRTEALTLGDQIVVLNNGRIEQSGSVSEVFNRPASLAVARIVGTETAVPGNIVQYQDDIATVAVGHLQLLAVSNDLPAGTNAVHVCIRAEDVILTQDSETHTSARNRIRATVESLHSEAPLVRVELDCGFSLKALLTRQSAEEMGLRPGASVIAWIKAPHIHLIPR